MDGEQNTGPGIKRAMKEIIASQCWRTARNQRYAGLNFLLTICILSGISLISPGNVAQAQLPDYDALDEILARNVRNGFVDYDGIAAEPRLGEFIEQLGATRPVDLISTEAKLAFYINAYNVLAIQGILDGQSPSSWWGRRKFFQQQKFNILGKRISLETLEHDYIIALGERRIHFALVCASMSCPRLSSQAYRPESLNLQLHEAARQFINDSTRNRFDSDRHIAFLSKIFDWYADDFAAAGGSLQRYLARFVTDAFVEDALRQNEFEIHFVEYDWSLNGRYSGQD